MTISMQETAAGRGKATLPVLFTVTIFTSALLLFFVQPLFTRMILPQIGGAPAVWTTAMLFFQTVLIAGYVYAHLLTRYLPPRAQVAVHVAVVALACLALPLAVPEGWSYDATRPVVLQTLWLYALGVGLPFAALSANAPLIQAWFRQSGARGAADPYFLYAASNLGSLVALLAFPLVAEPLFGITALSGAWSVGFVVLGAMLLASGLAIGRPTARVQAVAEAAAPPLRAPQLVWWAALAFLPSSLMLGVTTRISTDLGAFPLVWVGPLALYLLTFVLVFSAGSPLTAARLRLILPVALAYLVFVCLYPTLSFSHLAPQILAFFIVALLAHRMLFEARPDPRHLTIFYVTMSVGGALGGLFNSVVAPLAFDRLTEFPLTVAAVALLLVAPGWARHPARQLVIGAGLALLALLVMVLPSDLFGTVSRLARAAAAALVVLAALYLLGRRGLASAALVVVLVGAWVQLSRPTAVVMDRSFFGLHIVRDTGGMRHYTNGTTVHGAQRLSELGSVPTPLFYYHPKGALAEVIRMDHGPADRSVGILGLGIGAMACYAKPGEDWHFYEIDQKVVDIAVDPALFDFMPRCGAGAPIHLGDARIVLQGQTDLRFDVLVIDAYSSDSVPVHLTTLEAVQLYLDRLGDDGLLVFHITNRYYDLAPPLAAIAQALGLELRVKTRTEAEVDPTEGDVRSTVAVLARSEAALGALANDPAWARLPVTDRAPWTDDHANVLSALR